MTKQLIFIFLILSGYSQANEVISEDHLVQFHSVEFYSEKVSLVGVSIEKSYLPISISERSELISVQLGIRKGAKMKFKEIKDDLSYSSINWNTFYDGSKNYLVEIPPGVEFEVVYEVESNYSLFFSALSDKSEVDAGITHWRFEMPEGFQISTNTGEEWKKFHQVTFTPSEDEEVITFLTYHPSQISPGEHFNSWFWNRTKDLASLSESEIPDELLQLAKNSTREELAQSIFEFVQNSIRYVDIENGVNAVIPRAAKKTLSNKYGDCKDMSTLLVALYSYFGFDSYNAISKTNRLDFEFNFPSIAMANHMICVLELNGEKLFLDATEDVCQFGEPSTQIFGTEALPIQSEVPKFIHIPFDTKQKPFASINYSFDWKNAKISQYWKVSGKFNMSFLTLKKKLSKIESSLLKIPKRGSKLNWELDTFSIEVNESIVQYSTSISLAMLTELKERKMMDLNYLQSAEVLANLLFWNEKPLFNGEIDLNYDFNSNYQKVELEDEFSLAKIVQKDTEMNVSINFELDKNSQENFDFLNQLNNKLTAKPIIIYNEN